MRLLRTILIGILMILPLLAYGSTITGNLQTSSSGAVVNGTLTFTLNQVAVVSGTAQVVASGVNCYTSTSGAITNEPDPQTAPVLSVNLASGTLPAGTYFVKFTYFDGTGESLPSPEVAVILSSAGTLIVAPPANPPANATGWRVYISSATGTETRQSSVSGFGSNYQQTSVLISGAALPGTNTSACTIRFQDEMIPTTTYYTINLVNAAGSKIAGYPISQARFYGGSNATVNVSTGWPVSTGGVIYPQPIVSTPNANATQSIAGGLNLGTFPLIAGTGTFSAVSSSACDVDATTFGTTDIIASILAAMNSTACALNGGRIRIPPNPAGGCWVSSTQLLVPNSGGTAPTQKTFFLQGAGAGGLAEGHGTTSGPNGGTCIDMRYNAASCGKICTLGQGSLMVQDIAFEDTAADGTPFVQTTNTSIQFFRTQFYGNCAVSPKQTAFIFGGTSASYAGTAADPFQGYATNVDSSTFDCVGRVALLQTFANAVNFTNNHIFNFSGYTAGNGAAIEINPTSNPAEGNVIIGNLIEVLGYKYGINLVQNARFNTIIGNSCFDKGGSTLACVNVAPGAGTFGNTIIDGNVDPTMASITGNTSSIGLSAMNNVCALHSPTVAGVDHCMLKRDASNYTQLDVDADGVKMFNGWNLFEGTAPAAVGGFDSCYADSTAHALFCAYNGGSFVKMAQITASGFFTWGCTGVATSSATLFLDGPGATDYHCTNTGGALVMQPVSPSAGTMLNFSVRCIGVGKVAGSGVFTLRKNSSDTSITCTIGTGNTCSDTTHSVSVARGDFLDIKYTTQATETLASCSATLEKQ